MLKDALSGLIKNQGNRRKCKLGELIESVDQETAETLIEVLASDISTMSLTRTLASEGISLSREFLGEKRNCFKDPEAAKNCCLSEKANTGKVSQ